MHCFAQQQQQEQIRQTIEHKKECICIFSGWHTTNVICLTNFLLMFFSSSLRSFFAAHPYLFHEANLHIQTHTMRLHWLRCSLQTFFSISLCCRFAMVSKRFQTHYFFFSYIEWNENCWLQIRKTHTHTKVWWKKGWASEKIIGRMSMCVGIECRFLFSWHAESERNRIDSIQPSNERGIYAWMVLCETKTNYSAHQSQHLHIKPKQKMKKKKTKMVHANTERQKRSAQRVDIIYAYWSVCNGFESL